MSKVTINEISIRFDFTSMVVSIILLVVSVIIGFANYSSRAEKSLVCINKYKSLKKRMQRLEAINENDIGKNNEYNDDIETIMEEYNRVVDTMEYRNGYDFYKTCQKDNFKYHTFTLQEQVFYVVSHMLAFTVAGLLIIFPFIFYIVAFFVYS